MVGTFAWRANSAPAQPFSFVCRPLPTPALERCRPRPRVRIHLRKLLKNNCLRPSRKRLFLPYSSSCKDSFTGTTENQDKFPEVESEKDNLLVGRHECIGFRGPRAKAERGGSDLP